MKSPVKTILNVLFMTGLTSLLFPVTGSAQVSMNIPTHNNAPSGAYEQIQLIPRGPLSEPCVTGTLYIEQPANLRYCNNAGQWSAIGGVWTAETNGSNDPILYPNETAPDLKVGIGTQDPQTILHISTAGGSGSTDPVELMLKNIGTSPEPQIIFSENADGSASYSINYDSTVDALQFTKPNGTVDMAIGRSNFNTIIGSSLPPTEEKLKVMGDGSVLFGTAWASGRSISTSQTTNMMFHHGSKAAFFAGTRTALADSTIGGFSTALGHSVVARTNQSIAIGKNVQANGSGSIAIGIGEDYNLGDRLCGSYLTCFFDDVCIGPGEEPESLLHLSDWPQDADDIVTLRVENSAQEDSAIEFTLGSEDTADYSLYYSSFDDSISNWFHIVGDNFNIPIMSVIRDWDISEGNYHNVGINQANSWDPELKGKLTLKGTEGTVDDILVASPIPKVDPYAMRITHDRMIGINLDNPGVALDVGGDIIIEDTGVDDGIISARLFFSEDGSYDFQLAANESRLYFEQDNTTNLLTFQTTNVNDAKVGIGIEIPTYTLDAYDEINISGCYRENGTGIAGVCPSDENLKENIVPFNSSLNKLSNLQPVQYEYKNNENGANKQYGYLAQDVEQIFPEWVTTDADGNKKVRYGLHSQLHAIQAIKEIKTEFDETLDSLRNENIILKEKIKALKNKI